MWATTCERAKVVDLHFHDLRHGFTTLLQELGVDYEVRQALLGHKMPGMTAYYSHGGPKWERKLRQAVTSLEKAFLSYGLSYGLVEREEGARNLLKDWSGKGELNPRPSPWQGDALPLSYSRSFDGLVFDSSLTLISCQATIRLAQSLDPNWRELQPSLSCPLITFSKVRSRYCRLALFAEGCPKPGRCKRSEQDFPIWGLISSGLLID